MRILPLIVLGMLLFFTGMLFGLALPGISLPVAPVPVPDRDVIYQVSPIGDLMEGAYDGVVSYGEIQSHGDFGIATFHALDGEMIAFDGSYYQVKGDGQVIPVTDSMTAPFATVTFFEPDRTVVLEHASNFTDLSRQLEAVLPSPTIFYAIRIEGTFPRVKTRSFPAQSEPYPRLADARPEVFFLNNTSGTIAGFWTPALAEGLNVPGLHLHYLTADHLAGGHILDLAAGNITIQLDLTPRYLLELPVRDVRIESRNMTEELRQVEQS